MAFELRDPQTGKIKTTYLIAGGGVVVVAFLALSGRKDGTSGATSGGQSSDITGSLGELQGAIQQLLANNAALGGNMAAIQGPASAYQGGQTYFGGIYESNDGAVGDSNVSDTVGQDPLINPTNPDSGRAQPINPYNPSRPVVVAQPTNDNTSASPKIQPLVLSQPELTYIARSQTPTKSPTAGIGYTAGASTWAALSSALGKGSSGGGSWDAPLTAAPINRTYASPAVSAKELAIINRAKGLPARPTTTTKTVEKPVTVVSTPPGSTTLRQARNTPV